MPRSPRLPPDPADSHCRPERSCPRPAAPAPLQAAHAPPRSALWPPPPPPATSLLRKPQRLSAPPVCRARLSARLTAAAARQAFRVLSGASRKRSSSRSRPVSFLFQIWRRFPHRSASRRPAFFRRLPAPVRHRPASVHFPRSSAAHPPASGMRRPVPAPPPALRRPEKQRRQHTSDARLPAPASRRQAPALHRPTPAAFHPAFHARRRASAWPLHRGDRCAHKPRSRQAA